MIIVGKIIGGIIGYKAAVLLHADKAGFLIVGAIFGHVVDAIVHSKVERWKLENYWKKRTAAEASKTFFQSFFGMLGKIAVVDGPITPEEGAAVNKLIAEVLKIPRRARKEALQLFRYGQVSTTSFQFEAVRFFETFKNQPAYFENALIMFFTVAVADGKLKTSEEAMIRAAAVLFCIPEPRYIEIRRQFTSGFSSGPRSEDRQREDQHRTNGHGSTFGMQESYEVLGCSPNDPENVIKQRYRKLVAEYHPDKIISKDLPEDFLKFANEKFKTIQQAYESIKADRGFV